MENSQSRMTPGDIQVPSGRVPEAGLEYARKYREVAYHTALLTLLSREYEAARLDEAKSAPVIQVVDYAVPPEKKSGPHRLLITLGFGVIGFCTGCLWAFWSQTLARMRQFSGRAAKLDQLSAILHVRL
jgi:tyrosine-protein kinase Etk/Wzc